MDYGERIAAELVFGEYVDSRVSKQTHVSVSLYRSVRRSRKNPHSAR